MNESEKIGIIRIKMDQNGSEWIRMDQNGSEWIRMDQNGSKWIKMNQNESNWICYLPSAKRPDVFASIASCFQ